MIPDTTYVIDKIKSKLLQDNMNEEYSVDNFLYIRRDYIYQRLRVDDEFTVINDLVVMYYKFIEREEEIVLPMEINHSCGCIIV